MNIFCGAGTNGRKYFSLWKECGLKVDCFVDNNPELWGREIEGVDVKSFDALEEFPMDSCFYITCQSSVDDLREQLLSLGIRNEQIKDCSIISKAVGCAMQQPGFKAQIAPVSPVCDNSGRVLFDLQGGLVLGGVESWSAQTAGSLQEMGWEIGFLLSGSSVKTTQIDRSVWNKEDIVSVRFQDNMSEYRRLTYLTSKAAEAGCRNIVVNFIGYNLAAACLIKRSYPDKIRVIAIVHNDEDVYYECYKLFENSIDRFLFISEKIKKRMLQSGFQEDKLEYLPWEIACDKKLTHNYTVSGELLRIGYAGRIELHQKRMDRMISIAKLLKEKKIHFLLELAGSGSYEEEMKKQIKENSLEDEIQFVGCLNSADLSEFWKRQDIMVSCSDWEGHSISQGEAMANGVVPIVTDVSGARDDIRDGENGFIVEAGSAGQIVEKIVYLYNHRELLPVMGEKAHQVILTNNGGKKIKKLWQDMLM